MSDGSLGSDSPAWRILRDGYGEAAGNMARDEAILNAVVGNIAPPTLRLYQWERPAVSLGRFQSVERTLFGEGCQALGIPLVRRITGGRGILHGDDLTISIICPIQALSLGAETSIVALYERLAGGFLAAFAELGIEAVLGACEKERIREVRGDCFATVSRADVIEAGTGSKLLGSALHRRENAILQQISIPLHTEEQREKWNEIAQSVFRGPAAFPETSHYVELDADRLGQAIETSLKTALNVAFQPGMLSEVESEQETALSAQRYATSEWTLCPGVENSAFV